MFQKILAKIAKVFKKHQLPYMLIGGQAILLYGEPRLTQDIDITLGLGPDHLPHLLKLCTELGWKVLVEDPKAFVAKTLVLPCQDEVTGIRVDLMFSFSRYENEAIKRVRYFPIEQAKLAVASEEDLIIHKVIAGRPRDWEDVRNLCLKHPKLDQAYIQNWLGQFEELVPRPLRQEFAKLLKEIN